jgi:hypothetical protein
MYKIEKYEENKYHPCTSQSNKIFQATRKLSSGDILINLFVFLTEN